MLTIRFNGEAKTVSEETTLEVLLHEAGVPIRFCAVELNQEIVPKNEYASHRLSDGDAIEVVTLVGGG